MPIGAQSEAVQRLLAALPYHLGSIMLNQNSAGGNPGDGMQGYVPGQAQTRLSHANAFIQPQDQYNQTVKQYGAGGEEAMTLSAQPNALDSVLNFFGSHLSPLAQSISHGPTVVIPQGGPGGADPTQSRDNPLVPGGLPATSNIAHEAVHALLHGKDTQLNTTAVEHLVPADALVSLSRYYNPQEIAQEIPARAGTDPLSLSLKRTSDSDPNNEAGKQVLRQYATMLRAKGFGSDAGKMEQYFHLFSQPQGIRDDTQSFQPPNNQF